VTTVVAQRFGAVLQWHRSRVPPKTGNRTAIHPNTSGSPVWAGLDPTESRRFLVHGAWFSVRSACVFSVRASRRRTTRSPHRRWRDVRVWPSGLGTTNEAPGTDQARRTRHQELAAF